MSDIKCTDCGAMVGPLEIFPGDRCLQCHANAPEVQHELATMTATKLARMWGAK